MSKEPRILYVDIETSPLLAYTWSVGKTVLSPENIAKERQVICICYKFSDGTRVRSLTFDQKKYDLSSRDDTADKKMLQDFSKIVAKADIVVAHNGKKFDFAILASRLIKHKLPPLLVKYMDDSYIQSKSIGFSSRKLGYIGAYLGIGQKHDNGQNFRMWIRSCKGSAKDLKNMVVYCKRDVELLEKVYLRLQPYVKSSYSRLMESTHLVCSGCGSHNLTFYGTRKLTSGLRHRMSCQSCGKLTDISQTVLNKVIGCCKLSIKRGET